VRALAVSSGFFWQEGEVFSAERVSSLGCRDLAAHSPTERAALQVADIARRVMRGGELHHEVGAS
jgi:hypothetical protein